MPQGLAPKNDAPGAAALAAAAARNLQQRITSGLVLAAMALAVVYAGTTPFALLVLAGSAVMSWEWCRLVRGASTDSGVVLHAGAVAVAITLTAGGYPAFAFCALLIGAACVVAMTTSKRASLSAMGVLYVGLPAMALVWLRSDHTYGFAAIVFLFLIVWSTDTMAFVAGRSIGGPKLWPAVSPNKTWAGFIGGVGSSAILSALFAFLVTGATSWKLGVIGLGLGVVAQAGDLAESALKRQFNVKDASHLIPGHGGLMDRLDGFVAVATAAALLALMWNAKAPATALLLG